LVPLTKQWHINHNLGIGHTGPNLDWRKTKNVWRNIFLVTF